MPRPIVHHIPICPFCQRLEILVSLKGLQGEIDFEVVDITVPRSEHLLRLTRGTTALPVLELPDGRALKESLVLMSWLEDAMPEPAVRRSDAYERAVENLIVTMEGRFTGAGYRLVMNQDPSRREQLVEAYLAELARLDAFLREHSVGGGPYLFEEFGWAEAVFTPFFQRFAFVAYYEGVDIPEDARFDRVRAWRDACVAHPSAQQTSSEEIIKLYYDYSLGVGNGRLPERRSVSTFALAPRWQDRPMPPQRKYGPPASDEELGLVTTGPGAARG